MTQPLLQAADLRGAACLTTDAVAGIACLVEAMRKGDAAFDEARLAAGPPCADTNGRGVTHPVGCSAEASLRWLECALAEGDSQHTARPEREGLVAALNGVLGDYLAAVDSPLAIAMRFRQAGRPLLLERFALRSRLAGAAPRLLVLLHGLCMNDLDWRRAGHDHGEALARDLGYTPVYLHYNSGLSVSTNGRILARLMEQLYDAWPAPIERLVMLGHGMGGLVARSAIHHGALPQRGGLRWPTRVNDLVCLGTPHQGAALERPGLGVNILLGVAPHAEALVRLGKVRSAGINDLQQGNILNTTTGDEGTAGCARIDLPNGTRCYAVAASLGAASGNRQARLPDDGQVAVASALGKQGDRSLAFADDRQAIVRPASHLELLSSSEVYGRLKHWLA